MKVNSLLSIQHVFHSIRECQTYYVYVHVKRDVFVWKESYICEFTIRYTTCLSLYPRMSNLLRIYIYICMHIYIHIISIYIHATTLAERCGRGFNIQHVTWPTTFHIYIYMLYMYICMLYMMYMYICMYIYICIDA